jgi:hypothetical protein
VLWVWGGLMLWVYGWGVCGMGWEDRLVVGVSYVGFCVGGGLFVFVVGGDGLPVVSYGVSSVMFRGVVWVVLCLVCVFVCRW